MENRFTRGSIAATKREKTVHDHVNVYVHVYVDVDVIVDVIVNGSCHAKILFRRARTFGLVVPIIQESRIQNPESRRFEGRASGFWILDSEFLCLSVNRTCGIE